MKPGQTRVAVLLLVLLALELVRHPGIKGAFQGLVYNTNSGLVRSNSNGTPTTNPLGPAGQGTHGCKPGTVWLSSVNKCVPFQVN